MCILSKILFFFFFFTVLTLLCRFYRCFYLIVRRCLPEKIKYAKALNWSNYTFTANLKILSLQRCEFKVVSS